MVKVLNIITDSNIGGAGMVLLNYLRYCHREKFDVSVAAPAGSMLVPRMKALGVTVYEVENIADKSYDKAATVALKELIKKTNPDIVHTHGSLSGRIAARRCGKKIIYTRHCAFPVKSYMKHGPGRWANKFLNQHYADRIIAVGEATRDNLIESGISPEYIDMMMNGAEPVKELSEAERRKLRLDYGFSDDDFVIGIMARIEAYKGHDDILEAVRLLRAEGLKNVRLIVAGTGGYEDEFKEKCNEEAEDGTVVFAGFISDVSKILAVMDVQVNASYESETSSLSLIEGMSVGLPACVSDCGGNPSLIDDGCNGLIFSMRNSAGLAKCIKRLIEDRELYDTMKENAKEIYLQKFTGDIFAANVERVYMKVMKGDTDGK